MYGTKSREWCIFIDRKTWAQTSKHRDTMQCFVVHINWMHGNLSIYMLDLREPCNLNVIYKKKGMQRLQAVFWAENNCFYFLSTPRMQTKIDRRGIYGNEYTKLIWLVDWLRECVCSEINIIFSRQIIINGFFMLYPFFIECRTPKCPNTST